MQELSKEQKVQEEEYIVPYHYRDLLCDEHRLLWNIDNIRALQFIRKLLKPAKGMHILDAGCGDGRFCYEMRNDPVHMTGIDYSPSAIRFARAFNPDATFHCIDLNKLKVKRKFDAIVFIETLEHINTPEIPNILSLLSKFLKKGGRCIITVPSTKQPLSGKHYQHFTPETLRKTISSTFIIEKIVGYGDTKRWTGYLLLRFIASKIYGWRDLLPFSSSFFKFLDNYHKRRIAYCLPERGKRLIAICKKM